MSIVVQKYGGSSVASPDKIRLVAKRIVETKKQGHDVVVVVSAMGSTTDELLKNANAVSNAPSRRELDMLLSCGERASMALLSMAVINLGYEAISFTGSQAGVMTNDRHSDASIIEVRPVRVQDELSRGKVVIVAGFQGVSYKREITTLGRGGSDTTAVALAAALSAEYCEICSDVDGVYTADPRVVSAAQLLDGLSHEEMIESAAHGAKVLHAEAVEFARLSGIALYARATTGSGRGTRIDNAATAGSFVVSSLSPVCMVATDSRFAKSVFEELSSLQAEVLFAISSDATRIFCCLKDSPNPSQLQSDISKIENVEFMGDLAAVSVTSVGSGKAPHAMSELLALAEPEAVATMMTPNRRTVVSPLAQASILAEKMHSLMLGSKH